LTRLNHAPLFRGGHLPDDVIILSLHSYLGYSLSYRDLEEILAERGVFVDHTTIWRMD
jgi:transposase-like protein